LADVGTSFTIGSDDDWRDEIAKGETVLLLGHVAAVVQPLGDGDHVVNYLNLTSISRSAPKRRRREAEGGGQQESQESSLV
jgi:hypothetical protein